MNDQGSHGAIAGATVSTDPRIQRYRRAERAWWAHHGLAPTERFIQLASPAVRLRVLEVGSGPPVLFVHGTAGAAPVWARWCVSCPGSAACCWIGRAGG